MKKCPYCKENINIIKFLFGFKLDGVGKCTNCGWTFKISKWFYLYFMFPPFIVYFLNDHTDLGWMAVTAISFFLSMVLVYLALALSIIPTSNYRKDNE